MAEFELNSWGYYEIDFYNDSTEEEKKFFYVKFNMLNTELSCYFKQGNWWVQRISGMTFNISNSSYYSGLAKYLDHRLKIYLRKEKLKKLNE